MYATYPTATAISIGRVLYVYQNTSDHDHPSGNPHIL